MPVYRVAAGGTTCVLLMLGICRSHSDCRPFSSRTCSRYLPSGESAALDTWPLLVRLAIVKCSKGKCRLRCNNEYTPKAAAANTISTMTAVNPAPSLFCLAAWAITELLDFTRGGMDSWGVGASGSAIHRMGYKNNPTPAPSNPNNQRTRIVVGSTPK